MLRVTIDFVGPPRLEHLREFCIIQVERLDDDPGGERKYAVVEGRDPTGKQPLGFVQHRRDHGAGVLTAKAIMLIEKFRAEHNIR